jgi:hypothetical protein
MTFIFSCRDGYEQHYKTFEEFYEKNERNKGWFPSIIYSDVTELRNISYLDSGNAFGKFTYKNSELYDSIFSRNNRISLELFDDIVRKNIKRRPDWFPDSKKNDKSNLDVIKRKGFYILKNENGKKIYFILSS